MSNWTDIHPDFTEELQKEWEKLGFNCKQVEKFIENVSLEPTDAEFAFFLKNCEYRIEDLEEWDNDFMNSMRGQYNEAKNTKINLPHKRKFTGEDSPSRNRKNISGDFASQLIQAWVDRNFACEEHKGRVNINFSDTEELVYNNKRSWFAFAHWLTDREIDWACQQLEISDKYKILFAHRFHYAREAGNTAEAQAYMAFPKLVAELEVNKYELVFIPVVQNEFHWSLLVYETKSKNFCHYDTLNGANYEYIKPLVKDILLAKEVPENEWEQYLIAKHDFRQGNGYDCGVAVITFTRKIIENYSQDNSLVKLNLNDFDLINERKLWRERWEKDQLIAQVQIPQKD